jgi:hypothetical protein
MKEITSSDFMPELAESMVNVFCKFPVSNIEHLIHTIEEKHKHEYGELASKLLNTIKLAVEELGAKVTGSCMIDDLSVVIQYDERITVEKIKHSVGRACYFFWQHNIGFTKEAQAALES